MNYRVFLCATLIATLTGPVLAERPSAMKLFPEESVVFVRMANAHEFGQRFRDTGTGRMLADPQLKPFIEQLYGNVGDLYAEKAEEKVGLSWDDLQNLPKGEVAVALVARPTDTPAVLLLVDQGDEPSVAERLVDRAMELAGEKGAEFSTEEIGDVEITVVRNPARPVETFGVFEKENTIVIATDPVVLRRVLWHWDGGQGNPADFSGGSNKADASDDEEGDTTGDQDSDKAAEFEPGRTLAENERFVTILRTCRREQDPPPHLIFYVDPIELARGVLRDDAGAQFTLGLLPSLGLDGFQAIGGAITYAAGEYDELTQYHILLENPRSGVLQIPAFQSGDTAPQPFVPLAMETYFGTHLDLRTSYDRVISLVDKYRYEGAMDKFVKNRISDKIGVDFPTEILDNLAGRIIWMTGFETPARLRGQQHTVAFELKDEEAMRQTMERVMEKFPDVFEERKFGSVTYHSMLGPRLREMPEEERPTNPFVAIMDGYLFLGGSAQLFERCVAARDGTVERLLDSEDYARATQVLTQETAGVSPVVFSVVRPQETIRQWYEFLMSDDARKLLDEAREDNEFLAMLADALDNNELPPFETLAPYFAPSGGILYDTDNGYHGIRFTLRNETAEK